MGKTELELQIEHEYKKDPKRMIAKAKRVGREKLLPLIGGKEGKRLSYYQLQKLQYWMWARFHYKSDDYKFEKTDYWDTLAWMKLVLLERLEDDCDGFGYAVLGILYYVFEVQKNDLYRVACATETKEGHFVSWVVASDGIHYQMENRSRKVRSIKYFKDLGYDYWFYSPMTKPTVWYNPEKKLGSILVNTPSGLESDKPEFSLSKAFKLNKSKTLIKEWSGAVIGAGVAIADVVRDNANELASTIKVNAQWFTQIMDAKTLGAIIVILSLSGVFLRTITDKDIDQKRDIDD